MYVEVSELAELVADLLKVDVENLDPTWARIVRDATKAGYDEVRAALLARGYTAAQVAGWDRGAEYQKDIGLYFALVKGGALHNFDDKFIKALDRRAELKAVDIVAGGALQTPDVSAATGGSVGVGYMSDEWSEFSTGIDGETTPTAW